jgi:prepilin-type N-terminal cleavage/methylation domain-containing protein
MDVKPEFRRTKAEGNPNSEGRIHNPARGLEISSDFGFRPSFGFRISAFGFRTPPPPPRLSAFTLIELILVMAILTMAVSVTAPTLANFFRGRTLDSEARRLLALTRIGQNRAVSEGIPIDLWVNPSQGTIGLDAEPSYEPDDPKAVEFNLDSGLQIDANKTAVVVPNALTPSRGLAISTASVPRVHLTHPGLPTIRFLPDGTVSESSPQSLRLSGRDGASLWVALSEDKMTYEIRSTDK